MPDAQRHRLPAGSGRQRERSFRRSRAVFRVGKRGLPVRYLVSVAFRIPAEPALMASASACVRLSFD